MADERFEIISHKQAQLKGMKAQIDGSMVYGLLDHKEDEVIAVLPNDIDSAHTTVNTLNEHEDFFGDTAEDDQGEE